MEVRAAFFGEGLHAFGYVLRTEEEGLAGSLSLEGLAKAAEGGCVDGLLGGCERKRGTSGEAADDLVQTLVDEDG